MLTSARRRSASSDRNTPRRSPTSWPGCRPSARSISQAALPRRQGHAGPAARRGPAAAGQAAGVRAGVGDNTQSMRNFWRTLGDGKHGFTPAEASAVERTLSVGAFVKNHLPLVQILLNGFASGTYKHAARSRAPDAWRTGSSSSTSRGRRRASTPPATPPPAEVFARVVHARITRAYPDGGAVEPCGRRRLHPPAPARGRLRSSSRTIRRWSSSSTTWPSTWRMPATRRSPASTRADRALVVANARRFQRVLRVAPDVDAAETLLRLGIDRRRRSPTLGQQQFFVKATRRASPSARPTASTAPPRSATPASISALHASSTSTRSACGPRRSACVSDLDDPIQKAVAARPIARDAVRLAGLLRGGLLHLGPEPRGLSLRPAAVAAQSSAQGGHTALDALDGRRPDIRHLLLNCPEHGDRAALHRSGQRAAGRRDQPAGRSQLHDQSALEADDGQQDARPSCAPRRSTSTRPPIRDALRRELSAHAALQRRSRRAAHLSRAVERAAVAAARGAAAAARSAGRRRAPPSRPSGSPWRRTRRTRRHAELGDRAGRLEHAGPAADLAAVPAFLQAASIDYEALLELLEVAWVQGGARRHAPGRRRHLRHQRRRRWRRRRSTPACSTVPIASCGCGGAPGCKMWELDLLLRAASVGNGTLDANALARSAASGSCRTRPAGRRSAARVLPGHRHRRRIAIPTAARRPLSMRRIFLNPAVTRSRPMPTWRRSRPAARSPIRCSAITSPAHAGGAGCFGRRRGQPCSGSPTTS